MSVPDWAVFGSLGSTDLGKRAKRVLGIRVPESADSFETPQVVLEESGVLEQHRKVGALDPGGMLEHSVEARGVAVEIRSDVSEDSQAFGSEVCGVSLQRQVVRNSWDAFGGGFRGRSSRKSRSFE